MESLTAQRSVITTALVTVLLLFGVTVCGSNIERAYASNESTGQNSTSTLIAVQGGIDGEGLAAEGDSDTEADAAPVVSGVSVKASAYVQTVGWRSWVKAGKTAGVKKSKKLGAVKLKLTGLSQGLSGSINYRVYQTGRGWSAAYANGASSGYPSASVKAIKVWLSGAVATHYDVLYRVRIAGSGWTPWEKNKALSGVTKGRSSVTGLQVKLSPKTVEAAGGSVDKASVRYDARLVSTGWQEWKASGQKAGTWGAKAHGAVMDGFALNINRGDIAGDVKYRAYIQGKKWTQGWKQNGATAGLKNARIEALQIKLTGDLAKKYNIWYRTYVDGYGWLDWASNKDISGSTGLDLPIAAVQVKLVKKSAQQPTATAEPTVNAKLKVLNGIDISSWQAGINIAKVPSDFVIVKATGGKGYTNPYYKLMANATLKAGKLLGLYHFARETSCPGTAVQEADYFVNAVGAYVGRAVLVLDWEGSALLMGTGWAKKFLDRVYAKTGVRPLIYMSKSYTRAYDWTKVAKNYQLWVAQYAFKYQKGTGYVLNPWTDTNDYGAWDRPTMFQYTSAGQLSGYSGGLDLNIFYGEADDWKVLAAKS